MKRLICNLFILTGFFIVLNANANIINVPDDEENIQAAVDAAEPRDTILVADGEYTGEGNNGIVVIIPLTIMSENGPDNCVIDCENNAGRAFDLREYIILNGFTIANADTGINIADTDQIEIANCIVTGSTTLGIVITACDDVMIRDCVLRDNNRDVEEQGAAIRIDGSTGIMQDCVSENNSTLGSGAGFYIGTSHFNVMNTTISENESGRYGGGALITDDSECSFVNCNITDNNAGHNGGGCAVTELSEGSLEHCIISDNTSTGSGGGFYLSFSAFSIQNTIFSANEAIRNGGGLHIYNNGTCQLWNSIFSGNFAGIDGGGIAVTLQSELEMGNCDLINNETGLESDRGMGGGLYMGSNTNPVVINSIVWGNAADIGNQMYAQAAGTVNISFTCIEDGINPDNDWEFVELIEEENIAEDPVLVDGRDPEWGLNGFFLDPESPCIDAGSVEASEIGMDTLFTLADLTLDRDIVDLGFHYSIWSYNIVGRLFGQVTDAVNDEPIEGAMVFTSFGQSAVTDEEGNWEIPDAVAVECDVTAAKLGYNSFTEQDVRLEENDEQEINFALTHPEFTPSVNEFHVMADFEDTTEVDFQISNTGNGLLNWTVETRLQEENYVEPWTFRQSCPFGEIVDDERLYGVVFTGDRFFISGSGAGEPPLIYVFDRDGEQIDQFDQVGESRNGIQDLAWDGELLWGSGERTVFGFTTNGELSTSFEGPANPNVALAWDSENELIWISGSDSNIFGYDREGNQQIEIENPNLRIQGMAYWRDDPDGFPVYIYVDALVAPREAIYKLNPENGEIQFGRFLEPEERSRPNGAFITTEYDPYSWVLMTVPRGDEITRIDIWQLDIRHDWVTVAPISGELNADESEDMTLTLLSTGFPEGSVEAELAFAHNAANGQTILPLSMNIMEGPAHTTYSINLRMGWNLVSVSLEPDEPDVRTLTRDLVDAGLLMHMKDQDGNFYMPEPEDFNNIEGWVVEQGYWLKVRQPAQLDITGTTVMPYEEIPLREGWQIVSYYPRWRIDAVDALSNIEDILIIAKDGDGNFYVPEWEFNSIGRCQPRRGYKIRVSEAGALTWIEQDDNVLSNDEVTLQPQIPKDFASVSSTGYDMSLLLVGSPDAKGEIGVFVEDRLVGSGVMHRGRCGIAVRGDDPWTADIEGAIEGDELVLVWRDDQLDRHDLDCTLIQGGMEYHTDGFTVAQIDPPNTPESYVLLDAYPNPFNDEIKITVSISDPQQVKLAVYDVTGRETDMLVFSSITAGTHTYALDANRYASGVYFLRLETASEVRMMKIISVR